MGLFSKGGQSGRERRAMRDHLNELDDMRRSNLGELGRITVEMASEGRFDRRRLSEQAGEVAKIDREADLIARGLEEGLTLHELEDLARGDQSGASSR